MHRIVPLLLAGALGLAACGGSAEDTAHVVQAASKTTAEALQTVAREIEEAGLTPEAAKDKARDLLELAEEQLAAAKDSAAVEEIARTLTPVLDKLAAARQTIGSKIDVAPLQRKVQETLERFRDDPRVQQILKSLQEALQRLAR